MRQNARTHSFIALRMNISNVYFPFIENDEKDRRDRKNEKKKNGKLRRSISKMTNDEKKFHPCYSCVVRHVKVLGKVVVIVVVIIVVK